MIFMFDSDEKQDKHAAARGLSRLKAGLRKSDTQELDYNEVAEKQAKLAAEKKQAEQALSLTYTRPAAVVQVFSPIKMEIVRGVPFRPTQVEPATLTLAEGSAQSAASAPFTR